MSPPGRMCFAKAASASGPEFMEKLFGKGMGIDD
jgi:hypothetical protein